MWEYRFGFNLHLDRDKLDQAGSDGWELISVHGPVPVVATRTGDLRPAGDNRDQYRDAFVYVFRRQRS